MGACCPNKEKVARNLINPRPYLSILRILYILGAYYNESLLDRARKALSQSKYISI